MEEFLKSIFYSLAGVFIFYVIQQAWAWFNEKKGEFTGGWRQTLYARSDSKHTNKDNQVVAQDFVQLKQSGENARASITRRYPEDQENRSFSFSGKIIGGFIFGYFWSADLQPPYFGTILLRQARKQILTSETYFQGYCVFLQQANEDSGTSNWTYKAVEIEWQKDNLTFRYYT